MALNGSQVSAEGRRKRANMRMRQEKRGPAPLASSEDITIDRSQEQSLEIGDFVANKFCRPSGRDISGLEGHNPLIQVSEVVGGEDTPTDHGNSRRAPPNTLLHEKYMKSNEIGRDDIEQTLRRSSGSSIGSEMILPLSGRSSRHSSMASNGSGRRSSSPFHTLLETSFCGSRPITSSSDLLEPVFPVSTAPSPVPQSSTTPTNRNNSRDTIQGHHNSSSHKLKQPSKLNNVQAEFHDGAERMGKKQVFKNYENCGSSLNMIADVSNTMTLGEDTTKPENLSLDWNMSSKGPPALDPVNSGLIEKQSTEGNPPLELRFSVDENPLSREDLRDVGDLDNATNSAKSNCNTKFLQSTEISPVSAECSSHTRKTGKTCGDSKNTPRTPHSDSSDFVPPPHSPTSGDGSSHVDAAMTRAESADAHRDEAQALFEDSDDELPYVPTTLPQELSQQHPIVSVSERSCRKLRNKSLERPRTKFSVEIADIDSYIELSQNATQTQAKIIVPQSSLGLHKSEHRKLAKPWREFAEDSLRSNDGRRKMVNESCDGSAYEIAKAKDMIENDDRRTVTGENSKSGSQSSSFCSQNDQKTDTHSSRSTLSNTSVTPSSTKSIVHVQSACLMCDCGQTPEPKEFHRELLSVHRCPSTRRSPVEQDEYEQKRSEIRSRTESICSVLHQKTAMLVDAIQEAGLLFDNSSCKNSSSLGNELTVGSSGAYRSRLSSCTSTRSRSPSPSRLLLETSFCGPRPIEAADSVQNQDAIERTHASNRSFSFLLANQLRCDDTVYCSCNCHSDANKQSGPNCHKTISAAGTFFIGSSSNVSRCEDSCIAGNTNLPSPKHHPEMLSGEVFHHYDPADKENDLRKLGELPSSFL